MLSLCWTSRNNHTRVANGFDLQCANTKRVHLRCCHLQAAVFVDDIFKSTIHVIEKSDDLRRINLIADGREVNNVAEQDRHLLKRLPIDETVVLHVQSLLLRTC